MSWFPSSHFSARRYPSDSCRLRLETLERRDTPTATVLDLTAPGSYGTIGGAAFVQANPRPTGSGVIHSFVRIQGAAAHSAIQQGYNTDARPLQFDENRSPTFTRSLQLSSIPRVEQDGISYREFLLDINQTGSQPLLSLDEVRIFVGSAPNLKGYSPATGQLRGLNAIYDLDADGDQEVLLNYRLNSGSGSGDMLMYIPDALFSGGSYVYLYSKFGVVYSGNAGFQEWSVGTSALGTPPPPVITGGTASISGTVFQDINFDGVQQWDEVGIEGVEINLTGTDSTGRLVNLTARTDANGYYSFTGLYAGTYQLFEVQPFGYLDGGDSVGTVGGIPRGTKQGQDLIGQIVLGAGEQGINFNFAEILDSNN